MIAIKPGVSLRGIRPETAVAIFIAAGVFQDFAPVGPMWVTSVTEGKHSTGSLHYVGAAFDVRLPAEQVLGAILQNLKSRLGPEFDVVLEKTHIHIEFQPKTGLNLQP